MQSRNAVRCRSSNSLTSRVRQNSPRTRLLASNRVMLRQKRIEAHSQPRGRETLTDSPSASACPQRENFGHSPAFAIGFMARPCHGVAYGSPKNRFQRVAKRPNVHTAGQRR